jgi:hypothetical protein
MYYIESGVRVIDELNRSGRGLIQLLLWHMSEGPEENQKEPQSK